MASLRLQRNMDVGVTWSVRATICVLAATCVANAQTLQSLVDKFYVTLLGTWLFNSVYFETLWVIMVYPLILLVPKVMDAVPWLDRYKIDPKTRWDDLPWLGHIKEAAVYAAPFMFLDTFMVKKYVGVDPREWDVRRASVVQYTRALPTTAPTTAQIPTHLLGAFIVYDAAFFVLHLACHSNKFLYKHIHAPHHDHEVLTSRVSNKMTVVERVALVLCANESLKLMGSHPLTRLFFVPILLYWLMENHLGYDTPWGLHRVVPWGLIGGSPRHFTHHVHGHRFYEPFFTYIDDWIYPIVCEARKKTS